MLPGFLSPLNHHRGLIWKLAGRDIAGRYRGSALGLVWSFVQPLMMLAVYTYVFGVILSVRWEDRLQTGGEVAFAVILFSGLLVHGLFTECFNRAPTLISDNVNFVKKVIFPLEILPYTVLLSALFHAVVSVAVLLIAHLVLNQTMAWTVLLLPVTLLPLLIMIMGVSWLLASLGVFLRDIGQITTVLGTVMLFVSPIFFPVERMPESLRGLVYLNPISVIVDAVRAVVLFGEMPDWAALGVYTIVALIVAQLGYWWFQRTRHGFADVL
ncbi:MAG: ABC transporter permease [Alphaproteobacteria bacterium]|nr:ABC transporter permease [Alphaproteobacteria bacterium]